MNGDSSETSTIQISQINKIDNLPSRQAKILERLTSIRENKQKILFVLRGLEENRKDDNEIDKSLVAKMIESYDALREQEDQYMKLMQNIVMIRENAAEDVQHEVEQCKRARVPNELNKLQVDCESNAAGPDVEEAKIGAKATAELTGASETESDIKAVTNKSNSPRVDDSAKPGDDSASKDEEVWKEVEDELKKLGSVTEEAVAASVINEKLLETLQLHQEKRETLKQLRQKETEAQRGAAKDALEQVELTRLRVAAEQEKIERKQKTLERLRLEALRRGIKLGPGSASEPDILIEPPPEPKSVTEAKLRAKLLAKQKQNEENEQEDQSPPVPENLAPTERIPPISIEDVVDSIERTTVTAKIPSKNSKKKKGKKARENARQKREAINESIREKLAALKARKERIREIQSQLLRPSPKPAQMDEAYLKAQEQLKNLTAMREHLEELHKKGEQLPDEAAKILEEHLAEEEKNSPILCDTNPEQVETAVREEFNRVMTDGLKTYKTEDIGGLEKEYKLTTGDCERLISIEQALREQKQLLLSIAAKQSGSHLPPTSAGTVVAPDRQFIITLLRKCLFNAKPNLLHHLGQMIIDIANAKVVVGLDDLLGQLLDSAEHDYASLGSTETEESLKGNHIAEIAIESSAVNVNVDTAIPAGEVVTEEPFVRETIKLREDTPQAAKAELAKQRLNSGKGKLQKQRTLEKIRYVTDEENLQSGKSEGELEELEKNICMIVTAVVQWIREHSDDTASEALMQQLRDKIMETTSKVCFESGPKATYENQLNTIIDNALSPYYGEKIGESRQQLVSDISEILYNELAFFQLMQNIDNLVSDDGE